MENVDDASLDRNLSLRGPMKQDILLAIQETCDRELKTESATESVQDFLCKRKIEK